MSGLQEAVRAENISVTFDRFGVATDALRDVSFAAQSPGWTLISGHNGSGKSTLLGVLAGEVKPKLGRVRIFGSDPASMAPRRRAKFIAIARQRPEQGLVAGFTVEEHARLFGMSWSEFERRASELGGESFALLRDLRKRPADFLSGGERQVLGLGLQLLRPSKILLLDEPFSALDPERFDALVLIVSRLAQEKAVVQVTHEPDRLRVHAQQEIILSAGKAEARNLRDVANAE